jgi:hypothetical protein
LKERIDAAERLAAGVSDDLGKSSNSVAGNARWLIVEVFAYGGFVVVVADVPSLKYLSDAEHQKWSSFLLADEKIIKSGLVHKYVFRDCCVVFLCIIVLFVCLFVCALEDTKAFQ